LTPTPGRRSHLRRVRRARKGRRSHDQELRGQGYRGGSHCVLLDRGNGTGVAADGAQAGTLDSGPLPGAAPAQAAASPTTPYANPSMLYPGEDFHLDPGDLILVHVFMQDYSQTVRLGADGSVHLPFIGSVPLQGLTVRAAQALIADRLRAGGFL